MQLLAGIIYVYTHITYKVIVDSQTTLTTLPLRQPPKQAMMRQLLVTVKHLLVKGPSCLPTAPEQQEFRTQEGCFQALGVWDRRLHLP